MNAVVRWSVKLKLLGVVAISVLPLLTSCAIHYPPEVKRGEVPTPSVSPSVQPSSTATQAGAQAPFDLQFIDTMSLHNQGTIHMASIAQIKAHHSELKKFARQVGENQDKEIKQLKDWRDRWYLDQPRAVNMDLPGMTGSMNKDMSNMSGATGPEFDLVYIDAMTQDHAGAVAMAKEALNKAEHAEIKKLAGAIVAGRQKEIEQMSHWKVAWTSAVR